MSNRFSDCIQQNKDGLESKAKHSRGSSTLAAPHTHTDTPLHHYESSTLRGKLYEVHIL